MLARLLLLLLLLLWRPLLTLIARWALLLLALSALLRRLLTRGSGLLLELAELAVHVPAGLVLLPVAELVIAAVRAAFPTFRICLFAGAADDAFWEGHCESARIVHLPSS